MGKRADAAWWHATCNRLNSGRTPCPAVWFYKARAFSKACWAGLQEGFTRKASRSSGIASVGLPSERRPRARFKCACQLLASHRTASWKQAKASVPRCCRCRTTPKQLWASANLGLSRITSANCSPAWSIRPVHAPHGLDIVERPFLTARFENSLPATDARGVRCPKQRRRGHVAGH